MGQTRNRFLQGMIAGWARFRRLPHWLIALGIFAAFWLVLSACGLSFEDRWSELVFAGTGAVLFVPGAIRRGSVRHVVVMSLLGILAPYLTQWMIAQVTPPDIYLAWHLFWPAGLIALVGIGEWLLAPGGSYRGLVWLLLMCLSAAAGYSILFFFIRHTDGLADYAAVLSEGLMVLVAWLAIPAGFALAGAIRRRVKWAAVTVAAGAALVSGAMLVEGFYWLAKYSFTAAGPFSQKFATQLLAYRGRDIDYEFIFDQLQRADWSKPIDYPPGTIVDDDWRSAGVRLLIRHDRRRAADRLARLLLRRPSRALIDCTGTLFVDEKRYELAPIYMRYALQDAQEHTAFAYVGEDRYALALEEMEVPQVVRVWLREAVSACIYRETLLARGQGRPPDLDQVAMLVPDGRRQVMAELFGADAGPRVADWESLYNSRVADVPTPLTKPQQEETERVIRCFERYEAALDEWNRVAERTERQTGRKAVMPAEPDWNVSTTARLEREVQHFAQEVNAAAERMSYSFAP